MGSAKRLLSFHFRLTAYCITCSSGRAPDEAHLPMYFAKIRWRPNWKSRLAFVERVLQMIGDGFQQIAYHRPLSCLHEDLSGHTGHKLQASP